MGFDDQTTPYVFAVRLLSETTVGLFTEIQGTWTINFDYAVCAPAHGSALNLVRKSSDGVAIDTSLDVVQAYPFDKHLLNIDLEVSPPTPTSPHRLVQSNMSCYLPGSSKSIFLVWYTKAFIPVSGILYPNPKP